jgi:hypothetical protein
MDFEVKADKSVLPWLSAANVATRITPDGRRAAYDADEDCENKIIIKQASTVKDFSSIARNLSSKH